MSGQMFFVRGRFEWMVVGLLCIVWGHQEMDCRAQVSPGSGQGSGLTISWGGQCLRVEAVDCCDWGAQVGLTPSSISCGEQECLPVLQSHPTHRWLFGAPGHATLKTLPHVYCAAWGPMCVSLPDGGICCDIEPDPIIFQCSDCGEIAGSKSCDR
jgi:hypothetical protein